MINDLLLTVLKLVGERFYDILSLFLILIALQWLIRFDIVALGSIERSLAGLNKKIKPMNAYGPDNFKKVHLMVNLRTNEHVRNAWIAFYNDYTHKGSRIKSPDVRDSFNLSSIITTPAARRKAEAVPGIITAIGILGAFIGIFAGLNGADFAKDSLFQISDKIITSFSVVIVAVVVSIVYQLVDRNMYHGAVKQMHKFISLVDQKIAPLNGFTGTASDNRDDEQKTVGIIEALETILVPSFDKISKLQLEISEMLSKTQNEGVQHMVDVFVEQLNSRTQVQFESLAENTKELIHFQNSAQKTLSDIMTEMVRTESAQKEVNTLMNGVVGNLAGYNEKAVAAQEQISMSLEKTESFINMLTGIINANKEINEKLNEQRTALQQENANYFETINHQAQKTTDDLNFQVESIFTRFTELTSGAFDRLEKAMNQPIEKLSESMGAMIKNMDDQVSNISLYSKELSLEVLELNKNLVSSVKEFSDQLDYGVKNTLSTFDSGLGEISSRFGTIISDIKDSAEELTEAAGAVIRKHPDSEDGK